MKRKMDANGVRPAPAANTPADHDAGHQADLKFQKIRKSAQNRRKLFSEKSPTSPFLLTLTSTGL
jgi:hypothetical protein